MFRSALRTNFKDALDSIVEKLPRPKPRPRSASVDLPAFIKARSFVQFRPANSKEF
jgi:hypothetical protein